MTVGGAAPGALSFIARTTRPWLSAVPTVGTTGDTESLVDGIRVALDPVLMCSAAAIDDVNALKTLVRRGVDPDLGDYDGRTALHLASAEGHLASVRYLLDQGADPNVVDRWGGTPLSDAVAHGRTEVAQLLRARGASKVWGPRDPT